MPGLGNTKIDEFLEDKQYSDDKYSRSKNNACNKYLVTVCLDHVSVRIIISKELNEIHDCIYINASWYIYIARVKNYINIEDFLNVFSGSCLSFLSYSSNFTIVILVWRNFILQGKAFE